MPSFDIVKNNTPQKTFRVNSVIDKFELSDKGVTEHFKGEIDLPNKWNIGMIVGASGTGKTTILKELFKEFEITEFPFVSDAVINDMPKESSTKDIHKMFNSVGFSSPPSWLKPYAVLSNGEKMRVELAYSLLQKKGMIVFDEFTSVVDRQVAKVGSFAVQKAVRKNDKKFIAVGCHYDVEEWLMPDWVFDTNTMTMKYNKRRLERRPSLTARIYETKDKKRYWDMFSRYHYLNHSINNACNFYVLEINGVICGIDSFLHFPHPKVKNMKREHRLVVHPDYQGLGLGSFLCDNVSKLLTKQGFRIRSVTTNPSLSWARNKSKNWKLVRHSRVGSGSGSVHNKKIKGSTSVNRITASWEYVL
jgi:ABC-type lipoprotein export system ATPase subunit